MHTASPTSRTIVVRGGLLPADFNGRLSSDIPKRYHGARDTTFARSAREIIIIIIIEHTSRGADTEKEYKRLSDS